MLTLVLWVAIPCGRVGRYRLQYFSSDDNGVQSSETLDFTYKCTWRFNPREKH